MRIAVLLVILAIGIVPSSVFAESGQFGYKLLPEKLLEYTDGTLQVFVESNDIMIPQKIEGLKATSSNTEIVKIIGIEMGNEYISNIKIQTLKPGEAKIALASTGFMSKEIPIKVYDNNNFPTQIKMKITPNDFPMDGPRYGYVGVELLTTSGQPTKAEKDTLIKFSTPNNDIIKLEKDEMLIKKGDYYAVNKFDVLRSGEPIIFASTEGMRKVSEFVTIQDAVEPYRIQIYAFPTQFTSYSNPTAYVIIQLQDDDGVPIIAEKDIPVKITANNPNSDKNTSRDFEQIIFSSNNVVIPAGSYWSYTSFTPRPDLGDFTDSDFQIYSIAASADDYISTSTDITVIHERVGGGETGQVKGGLVVGKGPAKFSEIPFLTTGKKELMGVVYLEADVRITDKLNYLAEGSGTVFATITEEVTLPVMASEDVSLNIASSSLKTVSFINPIVKKGINSDLVFGNTGTVAPKDCAMEFYLTDSKGISTYPGHIYGPIADSLTLKFESLIPKVLAGNEFPVLGYLLESGDDGDSEGDSTSCYTSSSSSSESEDEDEGGRFGVTYFTENTVLTFSADEYAEIEPAVIKQNQPYALLTAKSNKVGKTTFDVRGSSLASEFALESHTTDPTSFELSYAKSALPGISTMSTIQVLDSAGNPVYAKKDIELTLVSNNESIINVPEKLVIPKDDYRTFFEIKTLKEGDSEIAILSEDLPLAKFDMNVKGIKPKITMDISGSGLVNEVMMTTLNVSYPGVNLSAEGMDVEWMVSGAEIMSMQKKTNEKGQASIELYSNAPKTTSIKAIVNGIGISNAEAVASYTFVHPEGELPVEDDSGFLGTGIGSSDMIYYTIPGVIAGIFLILKKTNRLDEITERLPLGSLGEKLGDIKDRVSDFRER